jgi:hypothetical protein
MAKRSEVGEVLTSLRQMQGSFGIFLRLWVEDNITRRLFSQSYIILGYDNKFGLQVNLVGYI